ENIFNNKIAVTVELVDVRRAQHGLTRFSLISALDHLIAYDRCGYQPFVKNLRPDDGLRPNRQPQARLGRKSPDILI
ncbi:MAG: hypothetical protein ACPGRU_01875, partial [Candidatus Puniceispirillaceae bacterium]